MSRPQAFILLGGFRVITRNWAYLTELTRRGLAILVITSVEWREEAQRAMGAGDGPASRIQEIAYVDGDVRVEGSYTSGTMTALHRWLDRYRINGVVAVGEMLVEQTGLIADALNLPGPGLRASRVCRSKYLQRLYLAEWSPRYELIAAGRHNEPLPTGLSWPRVLKPAGRRSSSGVVLVQDERAYRSQLPNYRPEETLLLEEQVSGAEYSVESLVQAGEAVFESVTSKKTTEHDQGYFVEIEHTVAANAATEPVAKLLAANRAILDRLDFQDGIVHTELRFIDDGSIRLMEIAARTPGDGILPLYQLATGQAMEPAILRLALGEPACYPVPRRVARQVYVEHPIGVLQSVSIDRDDVELCWAPEGSYWPDLKTGQPGDPPAVRAVVVLKRVGERLQPLRESGDRSLTFLIDADHYWQLDELAAQVRAGLHVAVANP
jgi:hypothetical protein